MRCLKSVSVATYLVKMSAGFTIVLILMILTTSLSTSCCKNRCLSSMCFAFFDDPILVAMLLPLEESVWILMLTYFLLGAPARKLRMCSASVAPVLMAYSSASALLSATVDCVRLPKCIAAPMNLMTKPVVDFRVVAHLAQSLST